MDKVYPTLDDDARQQLALQRYLSQLQDAQVAFGVKQRKPKTIEAAVAATLELESYLVSHSTPGTVAPVQVPVDRAGQKSLMDMMSQLMTRMEKLEAKNFKQEDGVSDRVNWPAKPDTGDASFNQRVVVCFRCGQEGHFAMGCAQPQEVVIGDNALSPREAVRENSCISYNLISLVNPGSSFSVVATINNIFVRYWISTDNFAIGCMGSV